MALHGFLAVLALGSVAFAAEQPADTPKTSSSGTHVHFGGFILNAGYTHFGGYPWWGYGYDPLFIGAPLYAPAWYTGFAYQPWMGTVKIVSAGRNSTVWLDGALAGRADKLRKFWLEPGTYTLEIRDADRVFSQRIYVLSGKTLKISPEARP